MQILEIRRRHWVLPIASLLIITFVYIALTDRNPFVQVSYGILGIVSAVTLVSKYNKEISVINNHGSAEGTVTKIRKGRKGGLWLTYRFVGIDGKIYEGDSDWGGREIAEGDSLVVVYNIAEPGINLAARRFWFYSIEVK